MQILTIEQDTSGPVGTRRCELGGKLCFASSGVGKNRDNPGSEKAIYLIEQPASQGKICKSIGH